MVPKIKMAGGTVKRQIEGSEQEITPPMFATQTIDLIADMFDSFPCELMASDISKIKLIRDVCGVYSPDNHHMWEEIIQAIVKYGCVTVVGEY